MYVFLKIIATVFLFSNPISFSILVNGLGALADGLGALADWDPFELQMVLAL
jgi:hypothetical protein